MFPKLRFKEFDGDLTESKLVELTSWASGGTPAKDVPEYWGDGIPLISGASMHTNQLYESDVKITKLGLQKGSKLALKDSILILVRGSMLFNKIPMGITLGDVAFNQDVKCIRPKQQLAPLFLFQWLHAKENTIQNKVTATGIGAGKLDTADLQNLKLYKPSLEEQTKIVTFLSAVDEKISQLTQKLELLSQYKQGMMQKLFSQQIRFKADDGSEFGEWEEKIIGEIANIKRGASPRPITDTKWFDEDSKVGWVRISDVSKSKKVLVETEQYLSIAGIKKSRFIPKGNIIMSICATIGKPIYTGFDVCIHDGFVVFSELKAWHEYTYYYLEYIEKNWYQYGQPGTQVNLNSDIVSNEIFPFPCLEEQTKIANFLSAIDQKIEVVAQQIEQAKQWKKGLLQQMFI